MKDIVRVLNVIAAGMCFVTYMRRGIEFGNGGDAGSWQFCLQLTCGRRCTYTDDLKEK